MFDKATRLKLRYPTNKGMITTEDLWDMTLQDLNNTAKTLNKEIKSVEEEDFLEVETTEHDLKIKLSFDIVLHVLNVKKEERKRRQEAATRKAEKEKLLTILAKKQDANLENMSEEELKKKLEELD